MVMTDEQIDAVVDLAERLRDLGAVRFEVAGLRVEFGAAVPRPVVAAGPGGDRFAPVDAEPRRRDIRDLAAKQGIGPLPFPGAARDGAI